MSNAEDFLKEMQSLDDSIQDNDYEGAISFALLNVPKVKHDTWFGQLGNGTYYADSFESRWFPGVLPETVAELLAQELL